MNKILDKVNVILYNIMQIVNPLLSPSEGLINIQHIWGRGGGRWRAYLI